MPLYSRRMFVMAVSVFVLLGAVSWIFGDAPSPDSSRGVPIEEVAPRVAPRSGSAFLPEEDVQRFVWPEPQRSTDLQGADPSPRDPRISGENTFSLPTSDPSPRYVAPVSPAAPRPSGSANPNFENIDIFLSLVADMEKEQGVPSATITERARVIREYAATSTNFRQLFQEEFEKGLVIAPEDDSLLGRLASGARKLFAPLTDALIPSASAVTGLPFGGPILYVYPCSCPFGIFALTVGPPSTASVLNYAIGTQAFLNYNLPASRFLLGLYTPAVQSCWQLAFPSCFPIPAAGQIQPVVGSSL